jgi:hypothetical protein
MVALVVVVVVECTTVVHTAVVKNKDQAVVKR